MAGPNEQVQVPFQLSSSTPAAPVGATNITWQADALNPRNVSGYITISAISPWTRAAGHIYPTTTTDSVSIGSAADNGYMLEVTGTVNITGVLSLQTVLGPPYGGTGITSYTIGDLLYASGATALSKLADVATGNALISGGVATAPAWGKIALTTHVSGVLPIANGGTNATGYTANFVPKFDGTRFVESIISDDGAEMVIAAYASGIRASRVGEFDFYLENVAHADAITQGKNSGTLRLKGTGWTGATFLDRSIRVKNLIINSTNYGLQVANDLSVTIFEIKQGGVTIFYDKLTASGGGLDIGTVGTPFGVVYGTTFSGSGSLLTTLNAANISLGVLAIARGGTGGSAYTDTRLPKYSSGATAFVDSQFYDNGTDCRVLSGNIVTDTAGKGLLLNPAGHNHSIIDGGATVIEHYVAGAKTFQTVSTGSTGATVSSIYIYINGALKQVQSFDDGAGHNVLYWA